MERPAAKEDSLRHPVHYCLKSKVRIVRVGSRLFFVSTVQNQDAKAAKQNMPPPPKLKALKWHGDLKVKMRDIADTGSELPRRRKKASLE